MIELTGIKSQTRPIDIDDTSSETTVYVRYNIREEVEIDPVFNTEKPVYIYDETQYTLAEWYKLCMNESNAKINLLTECVKELAAHMNMQLPL